MSTCKESPFHPDGNIASLGDFAGDTAIMLQEEVRYARNFSWKVSKHIGAFWIFINRYNVSILFILGLLSAVELVADCWSPDVLVDMVASNSCSHGQHESGHYREERTL